jgi:hypothetical protein
MTDTLRTVADGSLRSVPAGGNPRMEYVAPTGEIDFVFMGAADG